MVAVLVILLTVEWFLLDNYDPYPYELKTTATNRFIEDSNTQVTMTQLPHLSHFSEIKERPLFVKERKPPIESETEIEESKKNHDFPKIKLNAVIIFDNIRRALFTAPKEKKSLSLKQGEIYKGWMLSYVQPDQVVFRKGHLQEFVPLRNYPEPKKIRPKPVKQNLLIPKKTPRLPLNSRAARAANSNPFLNAINKQKTGHNSRNTRSPRVNTPRFNFGPASFKK